MTPLDPNEEDPCRLWAEIHTLRAALEGPHGFDSWQDAAVAERRRRVKVEQSLKALDSISTRLWLSLNSVSMRLHEPSLHSPQPPLESAIEALTELDALVIEALANKDVKSK